MRICTEFEKLTPKERQEYIGGVVHCLTVSSELFKEGQRLIKKGEKAGLFIGVQINPAPAIHETNEQPIIK